MDFVQINKATQPKKVMAARNSLYSSGSGFNKYEALIIVIDSLKSIYGIRLTAKIIHTLGVDKIEGF